MRLGREAQGAAVSFVLKRQAGGRGARASVLVSAAPLSRLCLHIEIWLPVMPLDSAIAVAVYLPHAAETRGCATG